MITSTTDTSKLDKEISRIIKRSKNNIVHPSLFKEITYSDFLSNKILIISIIREGVPYSLFRLIQKSTPITEENWANLLDLSVNSLQSFKLTSKRFNRIQSERIIEVAEAMNLGMDVFGDQNTLKAWLYTPKLSFGNLKPIELLKYSYGKELVISELTRINHGILI